MAFEEAHGVAFCVVDRDSWSTAALWGFEKRGPLESLIEENGEMIYREETWKGRDLGITFANGVSLHYNAWDDEEESRLVDALPVKVCNAGRCEGIIDMDGNRCETKPRTGDFCGPCKKYNDKVKAGKLRKCKYCLSTFHSTQKCKQNPKVIAADKAFEEQIKRWRGEEK